MNREDVFENFRAQSSDQIVFEVRRTPDVLDAQPDRSFSASAMQELFDEIELFVGARVVARWVKTKEPPSYLNVEIKVTTA